MAPTKRQKLASSAPAKSSKVAPILQRSSARAPIHRRISKKQAQGRQSNPRLGGNLKHGAVVVTGSAKNPLKLKRPTSYASRKRQRPRMSLAEVMAESARQDELPEDHSTAFATGSTALYTWGRAASQPVPAVGSLRRHKGFKLFGFRRGRNSAFMKLAFGLNHDGGTIIPFRFLDLPLEIRWRVYGFLLVHPKPVLVYPDWKTVHINSPQDHTILRVNRQIFLESSQILYEKNIFHAIINSTPLVTGQRLSPMTRIIKSQSLVFLKNVIMEYSFNPHVKGLRNGLKATADCLKILVKSGAFLNSVTLSISSGGLSAKTINTALQPLNALPQVPKPLIRKTIPEFFKVPDSKVMRVIPKLRCNVLNIVVRIPGFSRVLLSINLRDLPANQDESGWLAQETTAQRSARKRAAKVKADLIGLQKRLEDIFGDPEKAIMEGKARLMTEDETMADGVMLAYPGIDSGIY